VIIDTHCHLNFDSFKEDLDDVLNRARSAGIIRIVVPAIDSTTSEEVLELSSRIPEVYAAIGIHPNDCAGFTLKDIDRLHDLAKNPKVVAIGEIGLDKYHDDVPLSEQIVALEAQLDLAGTLKLPVLVHNRDADHEIETLLARWFLPDNEQQIHTRMPVGIMHAFSSSSQFAQRVISLGFYLGIAGPITYRNAGNKRDAIKSLDCNKIVLETDAPFLTPHPFRGKRNEPANIAIIAEEVARLWEVPLARVHEITTSNAARIFQWTHLN